MPDSARRFYADAFQGRRLQLETKFGLTPEVAVHGGVMQGGVSSPELSRPAQDPILRLREQSSSVYTTSHGRRVATASFSDDAEHYGSGVADIPTVVSELDQGTDWDDNWPMLDPATGISSDGIAVTSFDIWAGGTIQSTLQRTLPNVTEVLLGKATAFSDKHTLAAAELVSRLRQARSGVLSMGDERHHKLCPSRWPPLPVRVAPAGYCIPKPCPFWHGGPLHGGAYESAPR